MKNFPSWFAPAKLNLFLHITAKRKDGYHDLQTLFQLLDYGDELQFVPRQDNLFIAKYSIAGIDTNNDLILKAANLLFAYLLSEQLLVKGKNYGVDIYLHKKLPMGGGLGGGSSDAATTLMALNKLWDLSLDKQQLTKLGLKIGADVPVFVLGTNCWAEGVGEILKPYVIPNSYYVVVVPKVHVSTTELFSHSQLKRNCQFIKDYDFAQTENVFESIVRDKYSVIEQVFEFLSGYGKPRLTGTGACVYLSLKSQQQCSAIISKLPNGWQAFYAKGC